MSSRPSRARRTLVASWRALPLALALTAAPSACAVGYHRTVEPSVSAEADTLSRAQRQAVIGALDRAIRQNFAHWAGAPGVDYPELVSRYWKEALASSSRRDFDFATLAFLASLRNGHTDFTDDWLWRHDGEPLGFRLVWADASWRVASSRVAGLAVGDEVVAIDDEPFGDFFARQRRFVSASSERGARLLFASRPWLFPPRFTLTLASGARVAIERGRAPLGRGRTTASAQGPLVPHRWLVADSVAWLRIDCFNAPGYELETLARLREEYRHAEGVVIDVRGNCGGATPRALVAALADRPFPWWSQYDAVNRGLLPLPWHRDRDELDDRGRPRAQPPGRAHLIAGKRELRQRVVLLVDEGCASACEDFVMPLQWIGRATVVGDTTWGSSGQPLQLDFGGGMRARVSTRREYYPDGSEFEGVGIVPDVVVPRSAEALRSGADPALAAAIAILREPAIVQAARGAAHRGAGRGAGGRGPANRGARR